MAQTSDCVAVETVSVPHIHTMLLQAMSTAKQDTARAAISADRNHTAQGVSLVLLSPTHAILHKIPGAKQKAQSNTLSSDLDDLNDTYWCLFVF